MNRLNLGAAVSKLYNGFRYQFVEIDRTIENKTVIILSNSLAYSEGNIYKGFGHLENKYKNWSIKK